LLVLVAFGVLLALSMNRGPWFYAAEAIVTLMILLGVAGFLGPNGPCRRS